VADLLCVLSSIAEDVGSRWRWSERSVGRSGEGREDEDDSAGEL